MKAMHSAPRHILEHACKNLNLDSSLDWEHYFTGISDDGLSTWMFDTDGINIKAIATKDGWEYQEQTERGTRTVMFSNNFDCAVEIHRTWN